MLGSVLRESRKASGMTLAELADKIEVTTGYLSHLERGKMEPSLAVLSRLSSVLNIPVSMLFGQAGNIEAKVIRADERPKIKYDNLPNICEVLTPLDWRRLQPCEIEAIKITIPPKSKLNGEALNFDAEECIFVLSGELEYRHGNKSFTVFSNESIYVPKKTGHLIYNNTDNDAEIIWISKS